MKSTAGVKTWRPRLVSEVVVQLQASYPEEVVSEEMAEETLQQMVDEYFDHGEISEAERDHLMRLVPKMGGAVLRELGQRVPDDEEASPDEEMSDEDDNENP